MLHSAMLQYHRRRLRNMHRILHKVLWLLFCSFDSLQIRFCFNAILASFRCVAYQPSFPIHAAQLPNRPFYIEDGYNIILTDAPKDFGGRLRLNCARTTPEFPIH